MRDQHSGPPKEEIHDKPRTLAETIETARGMLKRGHTVGVRQILTEALREESSAQEARLILAWSYEQEHQYGKARSVLRSRSNDGAEDQELHDFEERLQNLIEAKKKALPRVWVLLFALVVLVLGGLLIALGLPFSILPELVDIATGIDEREIRQYALVYLISGSVLSLISLFLLLRFAIHRMAYRSLKSGAYKEWPRGQHGHVCPACGLISPKKKCVHCGFAKVHQKAVAADVGLHSNHANQPPANVEGELPPKLSGDVVAADTAESPILASRTVSNPYAELGMHGSEGQDTPESDAQPSQSSTDETESGQASRYLPIILCVLMPPIGLGYLVVKWKTLSREIRTGGLILGSVCSIVFMCCGWLSINFMLVDLMASSWEKEREEKDRAELAIHEVFFPRYKSQMESGRTAFNNRNFDEAANCFFEAEKIAEELNSGTNKNSLGAYISYDWSEKWAAATLGRAAAAVESGDRQGAEALIARALEKQRDALLPVQSNRTEALLRVQRQQMEASEKARRDARIPSEFSKDVEDYMKKLNGYSVRIEGERLSFSNPQVVSSNCKKDAEGNWFGILAWSVQIDSDGSKWTSMRYYFIGTLGYDYDWDFSLVRMQLGDSLFELDDDMSKLVPDF